MLQMKMAIQRLSPGRVLLLSAVAALFTIASLAWPASPMNRYEAEQFAQKHFPGAVINTLELRPLGKSHAWHLRFTSPPLSNASLLIVDAKTRELVRLTRWPAADQPQPAPRFAKP